MIKIVVADDHAVIRSGLVMLLNSQSDFEVVGQAADGKEAFQKVATFEPDILLMDINMPPGESGLVAAAKIRQSFPKTKIIILTMLDDQDYLVYLLKNGVSGYILKSIEDEELTVAIRTVYNGGIYIDPNSVQEVEKNGQGYEPFGKLTNRELEVLPLIACGYGNKEIAEKLFISVKTVEAHKAKIMDKLSLRSRPDLLEYALKKKLLNF